MKNETLHLPANCVMLNEDEMSTIDGGYGIISGIFYAFGQMFKNTRYNNWDSEAQTLTQSHGAVVSQKDGVYTYSDGYTYSAAHGSSLSMTIGDFFYGIGDLFKVFGL